jgi:putative transposase
LPFKAGGTPTDPNRQIRIGAATIALYYYKARAASESIAALGRKIRADAGKRWSLSESLLAVLKAQYDTSQRWNIQLHY